MEKTLDRKLADAWTRAVPAMIGFPAQRFWVDYDREAAYCASRLSPVVLRQGRILARSTCCTSVSSAPRKPPIPR